MDLVGSLNLSLGSEAFQVRQVNSAWKICGLLSFLFTIFCLWWGG